MRSPHAAGSSAKLLIFLVLGALPQISVGEAATKCPRGDDSARQQGRLRAEGGECRAGQARNEAAEPARDRKNPLPVSEVSPNVTSVERSDPATSVALAEREAPAPAEQSEPSLASERNRRYRPSASFSWARSTARSHPGSRRSASRTPAPCPPCSLAGTLAAPQGY